MTAPAQSEAVIQNAIRVRLGRLPDLMLMRNANGNPGTLDGRRAHFGLPKGSSDLIGVLAPGGRYIALEVKTATGKLRPEQVAHLAIVRRFGGFACVVRSVPEAEAAIERARRGESE